MKRILLGGLLAVVAGIVVVGAGLEMDGIFEISVLGDDMARDLIRTDDGYYVLVGDGNGRSEAVAVMVALNGLKGVVWERVLSDQFARMFSAVVQLEDGGIVAGGSAFYSIYSGDENVWLVKFDRQGDTIWEKQYGKTSEQNDVYAMAPTSDGGFIVSALKYPHVGGDPATWLLKLDADGNLIWESTFTGGVGLSVIELAGGDFLISGRQDIDQSFNSYVWLLRVNPSGAAVWERVYTFLDIYVQLENAVVEAPNGDFLIAGKQFVLRTDSSGLSLWDRPYQNRFLYSAAFTDSGKLAVAGAYNDMWSEDHAFVGLLSDDGSTIYWEDIELLDSWAATVIPDAYGGVNIVATISLSYDETRMVLARFFE